MGIKDIESLTVDDIKNITISFKKTEEDLILYKWILWHSGYSSFIKDKLKEARNKENNHVIKDETETKQQGLIDMDF